MKIKRITNFFFLGQVVLLLAMLIMPRVQVKAQSNMRLYFCSRWDNDSLKKIGDQTFNDLWGWAAPDGREYAIIGSVDSIYFIEVSDPKNPKVRAVAAGRYNNCIHRDMVTYSHYAYCVADEGNSSLQIFDLQYLPDSVHKVYDSDTLLSKAHSIYIYKDILYFAYPKSKKNSSLIAHALMTASLATDPEHPKWLHTIEANSSFEYVHDLFVRNDTAFLNCGTDGLWIYSFVNPLAPYSITSVTTYPDEGFCHSSAVTPDGKNLFFTDENSGMRIKRYDISTLKNGRTSDRKPNFKDLFGLHYQLGSIAHNPYVKDHYLICSYYQDGVAVFDINDSDKLVDYYDTYPQNGNAYFGYEGCWGVYPYLPSGTIIASDMTNGLFCLRLRDTSTAVEQAIPLEASFKLFPNPVANHAFIYYRGLKTLKGQIIIYRPDADVCFQYQVVFNSSSQNIEIPEIAHLPAGIYFLKINTSEGNITFKFCKI